MKRPAKLAGSVVCCALFGACVSQEKYNDLQNELNHTRTALKEAENYRQDLEGRNKDLESQLANLSLEASKYRDSSTTADEAIADLQKRLKAAEDDLKKSGSGDWTLVASKNGAFSYRIDETLLFDVGQSTLSSKGKSVLAKLATELKAHNDRIQIEGHTDSDPVKVHVKQFPNGNIELGADRAITVWAELKKLGVPDSRMSIVSYGPNEPVAKNDSEQGKSKNRRVDVTVLIPRDKAMPGDSKATSNASENKPSNVKD